MTGLIGLLGVTAGGVVASLSRRFHDHVVVLESTTGVLLIAGLALVGCGLPTML